MVLRRSVSLLFALLALAGIASVAQGQDGGSPPSVATNAATSVAANTATLNGNGDANGTATDFAFQYGTTTNYDHQETVANANGAGPVPFSKQISGLSPNTTYHFRAVALREGLIAATGADMTFTTTAGGTVTPSPTPTTTVTPVTPTPTATPAPEPPKVRILTSSLNPDPRGKNIVEFIAKPAGARGSLRVYVRRKNARDFDVGAGMFTVPRDNHVKLDLIVDPAVRRKMRSLPDKRARAHARFVIAGYTIDERLTVVRRAPGPGR